MNEVINKATMMLAPAKTVDYSTLIIAENKTSYTTKTQVQLINEACLQQWTTYEGRKAAVMHHMNMKRKVPIPICPIENITLLPTHAITHFDNHWLVEQQILKIDRVKDKKHAAMVTFKNGMTHEIPCSPYSIQKQMERAYQCMYTMQHLT